MVARNREQAHRAKAQGFPASADRGGVASSTLVQTLAGAPKQVFRFVARQPILNLEQQVFGYELLFRNGIENIFRASDPEAAARSTLHSTLLVGQLRISESEAGELWWQAMQWAAR